jgi:hypothetical protein
MLGWEIFIYRTDSSEPPEDWNARTKWPEECYLASWLTGLGGNDWLKQLVTKGAAKDLSDNVGYPDKYISTVGAVLPLIVDGPPEGKNPLVIGDDYVMPENWSGKIRLNEKALALCKPDDTLLIEAWDQS